MKKITTRKFKMGDVFLLKDQSPTTSSGIIRHNYIIVSEPAREIDRIMVIGISSCRNRVFIELIPFEASNGDNSYIDTNRVYLYPIGEIMRGCYHGCVEQPIAEKLHKLVAMKLGFAPIEDTGEIRALLDELGAVNLINGTQVPLDKVDDPDSIEKSLDTEETETEETETEETETVKETVTEDNTDKPSASVYPRTISNWPLWSLLKVKDQFKAGKIDEIKRDCNVYTRNGLMYKEHIVNRELNNRIGSAFSPSVKSAKRNPEFWKITDMLLFISRYEGGEGSRNALLESIQLTKSQGESIYDSCKRNVNVYVNKKGVR
jgi:hypothetical protein